MSTNFVPVAAQFSLSIPLSPVGKFAESAKQ